MRLVVLVSFLGCVAFGCDGSGEGPGGGGGGGGGGTGGDGAGGGGGGGGGALAAEVEQICEAGAACGEWSVARKELCLLQGAGEVQIAGLSGCDPAAYYECVLTNAECKDGIFLPGELCSAEAETFVTCHAAATESLAPEPAAPAYVKTYCANQQTCDASDEVALYECFIREGVEVAGGELCGCGTEVAALFTCVLEAENPCLSVFDPGPGCVAARMAYDLCLTSNGC